MITGSSCDEDTEVTEDEDDDDDDEELLEPLTDLYV